MKNVNQVNSTNDYEKFSILDGNRKVNLSHLNRLKDSFKQNYLLSPIIVNEQFEIIDGQHRFLAAKDLQLPINYIKCEDYSLREVQILNTNSKNWNKEDYLKSYCDLGYPEYIKFREFMKKYPEFNISVCLMLVVDRYVEKKKQDKSYISDTNKSGSYMIKYFENGSLKIKDYKLACDNANKILLIKPYYDGYYRLLFVSTMLTLFKNKNFLLSQFIQKLSYMPNALKHCPNAESYKLLIEEIYNYKSRDKVSLRY